MVDRMRPLPDFETLRLEYVDTVFDMVCETFEKYIEQEDQKGIRREVYVVNKLLSRNNNNTGHIYNTSIRLGYDPHELRDYLIARYTLDSNDIDWWSNAT